MSCLQIASMELLKTNAVKTNLISYSGLQWAKEKASDASTFTSVMTYSTWHAPKQTTEMWVNMNPQQNRCWTTWKTALRVNYPWFPGKARTGIDTGISGSVLGSDAWLLIPLMMEWIHIQNWLVKNLRGRVITLQYLAAIEKQSEIKGK